jgi:hypothetical protein
MGSGAPAGGGDGPKLIPVNPDGMPGLEVPNAGGTAGGTGRVGNDPSRGGWRPAPSPSTSPGGYGAVATPAESGGGGAAPTSASAPASGFQPPAGSINPNQGAPPPLSQLARLAGAASNASGATFNPGGLASAMPSSASPGGGPPGIPVPLPRHDVMESDDDSDDGTRDVKPGAHPPRPRSRSERKPMTIDVPFELVVACAPDGVVIHPGGYRISTRALKAGDGLLLKNLRTIVQTRRQVDPTIRPHPSIRFLVEPGGGESYQEARRQTMLSGLDWPVALQVSDSDILDIVPTRESL